MDKSHVTLLALFDASSAFDMVDHEILIRLETSFGLSGSPLNWFRSYLSDRSQMVVLGDTRSCWVPVQFGVPQGSVLGPLLYILFTDDISRLFAKYFASGHLYADDVQAYVHGPPSQFLDIASSIASLAADLDSWMSSNRLSVNPSKIQLIWLGTTDLYLLPKLLNYIELRYSIEVAKVVQFWRVSSRPPPCRGSPLSRRFSRPPAAICAKPASRPRKFRLSRALAEKNIRLSRRENCGLNTKKPITNLSPQVIRQSPRPASYRMFHITPPVRCTGLRSVKMRLAHSQLSRTCMHRTGNSMNNFVSLSFGRYSGTRAMFNCS